MSPSSRLVPFASAIYLGVSMVAACGSHESSLGGPGSGAAADGAAPGDEPGATDGSAASFGGGDSGAGNTFGGGDDASSAPLATDCQPGTYSGTFDTQVTNDAGGLFSLFSIAWSGTLTVVLQGQTTSTGGEVPTTTLTIAPGAKIDGTDAYNGRFVADLSGQLDCSTRKLSGTLSNAEYIFFDDAGSLPLNGSLSGTYDNEGGAPMLEGAIGVSSTETLGGSGANGTWTATLQ